MYVFLCSKCPITHTNIKAVTQSEIFTFKQSRIVSDLVFKFIQQINLASNIYKITPCYCTIGTYYNDSPLPFSSVTYLATINM